MENQFCSDRDGGPRIAYVLPTFGHFEYASKCLQSLDRTSQGKYDVAAFIVDDVSPDWNDEWYRGLVSMPLVVARFPDHGGLTRSWNHGIMSALAHDFDYIVAGNSDLLFSNGWADGMIAAIKKHDHHFVGPISNAPGVSSHGVQDLNKYINGAAVADDDATIDDIARRLKRRYASEVAYCDINGFCMMGSVQRWREYAYDATHFFPPTIQFLPSGRRNPTPLMAGQEDWLNARVKQNGGSCAAACDSFVFHYRSVSRGEKHLHGNWQRMTR